MGSEADKSQEQLEHAVFNYEKLCDVVWKIDHDAGDYMRGRARDLPSFHIAGSVVASFDWNKTPQGHGYWEGIDAKVNAILHAEAGAVKHDAVSHPKHYTSHPSGVECITVTEHMGFNLGNAVKYIWRADLKADAVEDLKKARWYIDRELQKRETKK